jgi:DNA repair ATPase RecN
MLEELDFWRLLGDYERLTKNESAALLAGAFDDLAVIQDLKDPVLETMRTFAQAAGLDRRNSELARRVDQLLVHAERNKRLIETMLTRAHVERQNLDSARQRLRGLGTAYRPDHAQAAFSAHG